MMKFDYGDSVKVISPEIAAQYAIETGSVCGFREVTCSTPTDSLAVPVGTVLVLVEGNTGAAAEIPEQFLELI